MGSRKKPVGTVAELFAGVGGFRCGFEPSGLRVVWSNQWEPATTTQYASECYERHFSDGVHVCEDIEKIVNAPDANKKIPRVDLLVGGFPCQDYSVAKPLPQATGIRGKKGVLWWSIYKFLELKKPRRVLLENVDRLLKSPSSQRGRDFAVILSCFARMGYAVEWRVVNAADYGFPQRRRRVFIYAQRRPLARDWKDVAARIDSKGLFARAFPVHGDDSPVQLEIRELPASYKRLTIPLDPYEASESFGSTKASPFENAGVMYKGEVCTRKVTPWFEGKAAPLGDIVSRTTDVPESFFISAESEKTWAYLKGPKRERRVEKKSGFVYWYTEGGVGFPDSLEKPARTILTGEGGTSPSRFKHVIKDPKTNRLRRLTPEELEELNGFERGWTAGMPGAKRAFMMGNALVVGLVRKLGEVIAAELKREKRAKSKKTKRKPMPTPKEIASTKPVPARRKAA